MRNSKTFTDYVLWIVSVSVSVGLKSDILVIGISANLLIIVRLLVS